MIFLHPLDKYTPQMGTGLYSYPLDDDESTFHLVDTSKVQKPIYQKGRVRYNQVKALQYITHFLRYCHTQINEFILQIILQNI